jgi:hypothetical protein
VASGKCRCWCCLPGESCCLCPGLLYRRYVTVSTLNFRNKCPYILQLYPWCNNILGEGCTNPRPQVAQQLNFCTVPLCGSLISTSYHSPGASDFEVTRYFVDWIQIYLPVLWCGWFLKTQGKMCLVRQEVWYLLPQKTMIVNSARFFFLYFIKYSLHWKINLQVLIELKFPISYVTFFFEKIL